MKITARSLYLMTITILSGCNPFAPMEVRCPDGLATEWVVGISNRLGREQIEAAGVQVEKLISKVAQPGDWVHIISLPDNQPVGSLIVPDGSPRSRLRHKDVREVIPRMATAFETVGETNGNINIPNLASAVTSIRRSEKTCRIILFGSPIYSDPGKAGWNFDDGGAPLDGSVDAEKSPFSTKFKFPDFTEITWATPGANWGTDKPHEDAVVHFVRYYLQRQNANLVRVTDTPDTALVFNPPQFTEPERQESEEFGMRKVSFAAVREKYDGNGAVVPTPEREQKDIGRPMKSVEEVIRGAEANRDTIALAVTWSSTDPSADLDLYLSSAGNEGELYYDRPITDWGIHYRDVQASGDLNDAAESYRRWEWVEVHGHHDINRLTLWINVYRSTAPCTVRIVRVLDGVRKERTVEIKCREGDGGLNRNWRAESPAWVRVELFSFKDNDPPSI